MEIVDPALDFLELIILLAGVCAICFNLIIPITKEMNEVTYKQNYDKTVSSIQGEKPQNTVDGCSTAKQIALEAASQSPYLPSPVSLPNLDDQLMYERLNKKLRDEIAATSDGIAITNLVVDNFDKPIRLTGIGQYNVTTATEVYNAIKAWCGKHGKNIDDARFKIMFYMGKDESALDNTYAIYYYDKTAVDDVDKLIPCVEYK